MAAYPCRSCIYFKVCGDNMRNVPCNGKMTKSEKKMEVKSKKCITSKHKN